MMIFFTPQIWHIVMKVACYNMHIPYKGGGGADQGYK